jgi:citrate lyase subunit beta / citryl-CoA lyase
MLAKAAALDADEVIVDLEDGVADADKERARELAVTAIRDRLGATTAVRINGIGTPWWEDDLRAVAAARPDVVVVPKVESRQEIVAVARRLPPATGIEAQIETARGLVGAEAIAAAGYGLETPSSAPPTSPLPSDCRC